MDEARRAKGNIFQRQFSLFNASFARLLRHKNRKNLKKECDREHFAFLFNRKSLLCVFYRANEFVLSPPRRIIIMRFSSERKYDDSEDKILPDDKKRQRMTERKNSPRLEFRERKQEQNTKREREMKIQSACGPCFFALSDPEKKNVFRVFNFFLKAVY